MIDLSAPNADGYGYGAWCGLAGCYPWPPTHPNGAPLVAAWQGNVDPAAFRAASDARYHAGRVAEGWKLWREAHAEARNALHSARLYLTGAESPSIDREQSFWNCIMLAAHHRNRAKSYLERSAT